MLRSESSPHVSARRRWLLILGVAIICVLTSVHARYRLGVTVGQSMLPTLHSGDLLIIGKTAYRHAEPKRGDIIVARYHDELIVKRIIALPGEEVEVRNGRVYVNDTPLAENGQVIDGDLDISRGRMLPGKFAVLGDNRDLSLHAIIPADQILGRVDGHIALKGARALSAVRAADSSASKGSFGPTLLFNEQHGSTPGNPMADFMYFVALISPEPVSTLQSPGNTQRVRLVCATRRNAGNSFVVTSEFEFSGEGYQKNVFDQTDRIHQNEGKLRQGAVLEHLLSAINVEGSGALMVEVLGAMVGKSPQVNQQFSF